MNNNREEFSILTHIGDQLTDGVILYDLTHDTVLYVNEPGTVMTGIQSGDKPEQIIRLWQQVMMQDRAYISAQYNTVLKESGSRSAEFGLSRDGQEKKFLQATGCTISNGTLLVVFLRDITKLKEHEDYLVEFGTKKNTLLETLTHNLSGVLNLNRELAAQAEKHADNSSKQLMTVLSLIRENNQASLKIIEDFLVYEHEKSPRIHIKATRIDLVEKIGFVHQQLRHSYPDRIIQLTSTRPELHVTTDEVKLLQVVNNLGANAVKFSPPDRPIVIHIEARAKDVIISVKDLGIGIPELLKPLIFLRQPGTGRTGLNGEVSNGKGLAICKHLVDMIKGKIWFESTEHTGSTFFIRLPYTLSLEGQGATEGNPA